MLVLTRRDGETIGLRLPNGDEIEVALIGGEQLSRGSSLRSALPLQGPLLRLPKVL
ncbi:MAG: hypothetical protein F2736_04200 [Actinobacteria bacterium]|nr:hypothetical protein [Actinomycetota bacterium]MSX81974.1 hypothetical protein [Actinomycetota bacterium]